MFAVACSRRRRVRGLNAGARELSRAELDALTEHASATAPAGLVWAFVQDDGTWRSPTAKFLTDEQRDAISALGRRPGDLLLIVADERRIVADGARRAAARAGAALRPRRDGRQTSSGSSTSRCSSGTSEGRWDRDAPSVHRRRPATSRDPGGCARAPTTSCSTASRSAAGRSVSTAPRSSSRSSTCSASPRGGGGALRLPARRAALRRAAARRDRVRPRPERRRAARRARLDPRRDRVPEDGERSATR